MIESCSKKRMLLACLLLISVSVVVLVIENNFKMERSELKASTTPFVDGIEPPCWTTSYTEVEEECRACSDLEKKIQDYCASTGYAEKVRCVFDNNTNKLEYKSCPPLRHLEERVYWIFELVMLAMALLSYSVVYIRQNKLNRELMERVHRQIAAGV